jgi:hypothetical protein
MLKARWFMISTLTPNRRNRAKASASNMRDHYHNLWLLSTGGHNWESLRVLPRGIGCRGLGWHRKRKGRTKQRIIANLGCKEVVVARGDLDRLARSIGIRFLQCWGSDAARASSRGSRRRAPARAASNFRGTPPGQNWAPFNVQQINGQLYVTFALQDAAKHDDVAGMGNGFVDVFISTRGWEPRLTTSRAILKLA